MNGVMTQGYCTPVFNAFKQAGKENVPATCYGYNGELGACDTGGNECASAQRLARRDPDRDEERARRSSKASPLRRRTRSFRFRWCCSSPRRRRSRVKVPGVTVQVIRAGVNYFPKLPAGLALPYTLPQYKIAAKDAVGKK